jgi:phenylacetate-coenzyme A ligase PaaK-like adenylate-forming protein
MENFFGCPFVMEYGGVEFGTVAHNTPAQPYRVYWWDSVMETLPEAGTAAPDARPVAVTPIHPRYFPLIRYRNGDEIRGAEGFGGAVTRFSEVCGRHNDAVELGDGSSVHSVGLFHCIHQEPRVYNIQLVLERAGLRLLLVADEADPGIAGRIRRRLLDLNPALESCKIEFVGDLVTNRAGKRRWVVDNR